MRELQKWKNRKNYTEEDEKSRLRAGDGHQNKIIRTRYVCD